MELIITVAVGASFCRTKFERKSKKINLAQRSCDYKFLLHFFAVAVVAAV